MPNAILEKLLSVREGIGLCWLGNLSWLIGTRDLLIAVDLDLDLEIRIRESPVPAAEIAPALDLFFITHGHGDHFNSSTAAILVEKSDCLFVVPASCRQKAEELDIPQARLRIAVPRQPFDLPGLHVEPMRALHGDRDFTVYRHANLEDCGYLFTINGKRFLQPGDTVLLQDHLDLTDIDVLFVSPTIHNMHVDRSTILINALEPDYIFPQHFGTYIQDEDNFFWTRGYPNELKAMLSRPLQKRYHKLEQGEIFTIP